jgi:hypothetical protein
MMAAMIIGMVVFGGATNMALAMAVWMRHRGHGRPATGHMVAAYIPLAVGRPDQHTYDHRAHAGGLAHVD